MRTGTVRFMHFTNSGKSFVVVTRSILTAKITNPFFSKYLVEDFHRGHFFPAGCTLVHPIIQANNLAVEI